MTTYPIADMFTRIRNASVRNKENVKVPFSKLKLKICEKLKANGFLLDYKKEDNDIEIKIKRFQKESLFDQLKIISKPSQQISVKSNEIKKKCSGKKLYLLSTSHGLLTQKEAIEKKVGGILIGFVSKKIFYVNS